ncbi:50S ribosomal protein L34e [archaeon]|jgi:large subunit ribosomal protein L34e|nr:50S ribosomal protein L34e [archaeon]MBT4646854.1 50S ribosomal protein L34e [archaeon]MBT6822099.1 50S ribosomal protein L34e [archaeon]MBT7392588.1 50S ribosomal protein L34e [archaeon]
MSQGRTKSRTMSRTKVRLPGGSTVTHYNKKKPSKAKCAACGKLLSGVPRERPFKMQNMPKNQKRPERPFGGVLCSSCSRNKIKTDARN